MEYFLTKLLKFKFVEFCQNCPSFSAECCNNFHCSLWTYCHKYESYHYKLCISVVTSTHGAKWAQLYVYSQWMAKCFLLYQLIETNIYHYVNFKRLSLNSAHKWTGFKLFTVINPVLTFVLLGYQMEKKEKASKGLNFL